VRESDSDDKPQEEGTKKYDLSHDKETKDKEVRTPKPRLDSKPKSGVSEVKSVQVGSFLLSPNESQLIAESTSKNGSESLSWGDRAECEEDLPSPLAFSASTRIHASKGSLNSFVVESVVDSWEEAILVTVEKMQLSPAMSQCEVLKGARCVICLWQRIKFPLPRQRKGRILLLR
jgi:hypothetical protein